MKGWKNALWAENGALIRPRDNGITLIDSDLFSFPPYTDSKTCERALLQLIRRYGTNPLAYPKSIFKAYLGIINRWE